ncbi:hypothetical protein [Devosia sediminis]|uniref:Uncharacterized protein n=1 Tax=Devosia sediminis TaxID=2798801 RepID=A0A934MSU6_9HYPH|nr:hypothetical protein [Devosia sediminis]MBJ3786799.1 hypothetical protein [Devosia sediminis]
MATTAQFDIARPRGDATRGTRDSVLAFFALTGLPVGLFGLANLLGEALGILPLYFSPFGLPGWAGAVAHLAQLALLGSAYWALTQRDLHTRSRFWLMALIAAYIALPFVTPPLDSLQLSMVCTGLMLLAIATATRIGAVSPLAGWLTAPLMAVLGLSSVMGLAISAAYAPPFAITQVNQAAPAA